MVVWHPMPLGQLAVVTAGKLEAAGELPVGKGAAATKVPAMAELRLAWLVFSALGLCFLPAGVSLEVEVPKVGWSCASLLP